MQGLLHSNLLYNKNETVCEDRDASSEIDQIEVFTGKHIS